MTIAVGVDVGLRTSDVVALDRRRRVSHISRVSSSVELRDLVDGLAPAIVALDGPSQFSSTSENRAAERRLAGMGISCYPCPPAARAEVPFFAWMHVSIAMFGALRAAGHHAIEVFPNATAQVLHGRRPRHLSKATWRRAALEACGVDHTALRSQHALDAALAALTGLLHVEGRTIEVGDADGVVVLPSA